MPATYAVQSLVPIVRIYIRGWGGTLLMSTILAIGGSNSVYSLSAGKGLDQKTFSSRIPSAIFWMYTLE